MVNLPEPRGPAPRWRAVAVTILAVAFVARLTLSPVRVDPNAIQIPFTCLLNCHIESLRDLLSNVLLFLPLGWALRHWLRPARIVWLCLLASVAIEALQAGVIAGRDSSLRDILSNTAGGALGVWLFDNWRQLRWPTWTSSARFGGYAALIWTGLILASARGTELAPSDRPWYGGWTPDLGLYDRYPGRLLSVELNGWTPPNGLMSEPVPLREAMRRDSFLLTVQVVSGPPSRRAAPIFLATDGVRSDQMFVGQDRRALWLHLRNRFDAWELRGLIVRLPLFPGRTPGDTVRIEAGIGDHTLFLRASTSRERAEVRLPMTVGWGWSTIMPFRYPVYNEWLVMNPLWLGCLIIPVGYWLARARPGAGLAITTGTLVVGLALVPLLTGNAPTTRVEWIGGLCGVALGCGAGAWSRRVASVPPAGR